MLSVVMLDVIVLNAWHLQTGSKASCLPPIPTLFPWAFPRKQGWDWRETGSFTPSLEAPQIQHNDIQHNNTQHKGLSRKGPLTLRKNPKFYHFYYNLLFIMINVNKNKNKAKKFIHTNQKFIFK